ncbi:tandem-95 repeat protein, partial [Vibrio sp. E150_011]
VGSQTAFTLPTSEEAANADNGVDIASLFATPDEDTDNAESGGDSVTISDISMPNGTITDNGDGTYTITPDENFNGNFEIDYTVDDGNGGVSPAQLDVSVTAVNDAAVIYDQNFSMDEDGTLRFTNEDLLVSATDIDGDDLTVSGVHYEGGDGILTTHDDGSHTFAPNENFNGSLNLSFDVSDGSSTSSAAINVDVVPVNDGPVASEVSLNVDEDRTLVFYDTDLLENTSDIDGDDLSIINVGYQGDQGVLINNDDGSYSFTPSENFSGQVELSYTVSDGLSEATQVIKVNVDSVADAPELVVTAAAGQVINAEGLKVDPDDTLELNIAASLTDLDDSESLTVDVSGIPVGSTIHYDNQTVLNNQDDGITSYVDSEITVTFEGETAGFRNAVGYYKVDENGQIQDVEVVYENASQVGGGGNLIPGESSFSFDLPQGDSFNLFVIPNGYNHNNFDSFSQGSYEFRNADGTPATTDSIDPQLVFVEDSGEVSVIQSQHGDAIFHGGSSSNLNQDGIDHSRTYFNDNDELVYGIEDMFNGGDRDYSDFLFTIDLGETNTSIYRGEVTVSDETPIILPIVALNEPVLINLPNEYSGEFDVLITATATEMDNEDTSLTTQSIHIDAREHAPESEATSSTVDEDHSIIVTQDMLLEHASDQNNDTLIATDLVTSDPNATVVDNDDGTFTVTPSQDFNGDLALSYKISDGEFTIDNTFNLSVSEVNDAATSEAVLLASNEDEIIHITQSDLLALAQDVDGDTLTAKDLAIDATFGDLIDHQDGTWSFTPNENYNGEVPFNFNIDDGTVLTPAQGRVDIQAINDAPDAPLVTMSTDEDQLLIIDPSFITNQATDLDGDTLTLESLNVRAPENATLQQQPDGMYHLVTSQDFNGLVELEYLVSDGELTAQGTLNVDVIPVNDEPFTVGNASLTTSEDGAFTFDTSDMMNLFGDIDTDELVISRVIMPDNEDGGEVTDNGDGTWTFTPTENFAGISELKVIASDGEFETALDVPIFVRPIADGAVITTAHEGPLVFSEDTAGYLNLDVNLIDDSEFLSNLMMTGYPVGFEVSDGNNTVIISEPGQVINITHWDVDNLQMTPPDDFNGNFFVTVSATTVDYGDEPEQNDEVQVGGDFNLVSGNAITLNHDDLINMAQNVDADPNDDIQMVHLINPDSGTLVQNDNGSWTFTPSPDFLGSADFAYVIEKDGILYDEQSDIRVFDSESSMGNISTIQGIGEAEVEESQSISFNDSDMLATISSDDNQDLNIESVSLLEGQGLIESDGQGNYQFTAAEGYVGQAQIGFIASDGENSVQSHFNIGVETTIENEQALHQSEDGSIDIEASDVLLSLGLAEDSTINELSYIGDQGAIISTDDDQWTFWPDEGFSGDIEVSALIQNDEEEQTYSTSLHVETDGTEHTPSEMRVDDTESENSETAINQSDITAAPGDEININAPDDVSSAEGVEHIVIRDLPEGAEINGALNDGEGGYTISGDLTQPVTLVLGDDFEGQATLTFQGYDELDSPVDSASGTLQLDIDDQYSMQSSTQQTQDTSSLQQTNGSDWTQSDNTQVDIDFTDDSGSFGTDDNSASNPQSDVDDNLV